MNKLFHSWNSKPLMIKKKKDKLFNTITHIRVAAEAL